jgi:abortive infection bacteriophage resistance protein
MAATALKPPRSIAEQKRKLASHGIEFDGYSDEDVERILLRTNYYRLTGYALQFRIDPSRGRCVAKTQLHDIVMIYFFDADIRNFILRYTEPVEIKLRTVIAYEYSTAHCTNPPHDQHLSKTNYYRQKAAGEIIDAFFREEKYSDKPLFVSHHMAKYGGYAPLWVMVETMPFSRLSKYYNCLYDNDKKDSRTLPNLSGQSSQRIAMHRKAS